MGTQLLKALVSLAEDPSLVLSTQIYQLTIPLTPALGDLTPFSGTLDAILMCALTAIHIYVICFNMLLKKN